MRWSIEELVYAFNFYREYNILSWVKNFPKNTWRRIKLIVNWIAKGYTSQSIWDLDNYLEKVIIFRLEKFKKLNRYSYPAGLNSLEEWHNLLDEMIDHFKKMNQEYYVSLYDESGCNSKMLEVEKKVIIKGVETVVKGITFIRDDECTKKIYELSASQLDNDKKALELFSKYFKDLWD